MCTHAAPTLRLSIEAEWGTPDRSPWDNDPSYRFTLQQESSTGWTSLEEGRGFSSTADAAAAAAQALQRRAIRQLPAASAQVSRKAEQFRDTIFGRPHS
ncbi:hypothetical protein [Paenarthrobacter nicotinovorans]|uniref:hypothetical protein n=1 Tax=Paenarthrobacter nicotinovorans TaxID=29320 RepID=UPI0011A0025C|nr:hypothetical protein [Paenarthrobacter nicotinovorans]